MPSVASPSCPLSWVSYPYRRPSRSLDGNLAALWQVHGRRKTEATVEALLGSLDHKCTLVHLALGGRVCLGYRGGRSPSRESGTRGGEVPDVRSEHRPPNPPFYPSCRHRCRANASILLIIVGRDTPKDIPTTYSPLCEVAAEGFAVRGRHATSFGPTLQVQSHLHRKPHLM